MRAVMSRPSYVIAARICFLLAIHPVVAMAQLVTGNLEFRVLDQSGQAVADAVVSVTGPNLQGERRAVSTLDGFVRVSSLPVGEYAVRVSHASHQYVRLNEVFVSLGRTTNLGEIELLSLPVETVVVVGRQALIDTRSTSLGANLTFEELDLLPNNRDYRSAITFLPQANASFLGDAVNIAGSTGSENLYSIDGVNTTDPLNGAFGSGLPYNFIREIQVISGGYQAEYGRNNGGVINVITHSGTNEFQGRGYAYFSNNDFAADNRRGAVELQNADFTRYDIGLGMGGPIVRDKLWFFSAYNPSVEKENLEIPGLGFHTDERIIHQFAGKLTWKAAPNTRFDFTAFGDPTQHDRVGSTWFDTTPSRLANADPFLSKLDVGGLGLSLKGQHVMGRSALFEASVSHFNARNKIEPSTERGRNERFFADYTTGTWSGGVGAKLDDSHTRRNAAHASGTFYLNRHEVKAGLEYEGVRYEYDLSWRAPDGTFGIVEKYADTYWTTFSSKGAVDVQLRYPGAFVQDSWAITNRLLLNVGVRWDGMYFYNHENDLLQRIDDQFAPRVGFVYQIGESGSQKISGSYGRFYEQLPNWVFLVTLIPLEEGTYILAWPCDPRSPTPGCAPADTLWNPQVGAPVDDLKGQHFDEFALGYERRLGGKWRAGINGLHRELRETIVDAVGANATTRFGNPGRGNMADFPSPIRRYTALELTLGRTQGVRSQFNASYVLSRNYGNYVGVYDTDTGIANAHGGYAWDTPVHLVKGEGLLPNDRTHVFKIYGAHTFDFGLTAGTFFVVGSGTPLSEFGAHPRGLIHLEERGTGGRTPWIWDWNLRFAYDLGRLTGFTGRSRQRLLLDVLHAFGQREAVNIDQRRFLASSGTTYEEIVANQTSPNPNYLAANAFQPPMTIRLGLETTF